MGQDRDPRTCRGISLRFNNINLSIYLKTINELIALPDLQPIHHTTTFHISAVALLWRSLREHLPTPQDFDVFAVIHFFIVYTTFHCFHFYFFLVFPLLLLLFYITHSFI